MKKIRKSGRGAVSLCLAMLMVLSACFFVLPEAGATNAEPVAETVSVTFQDEENKVIKVLDVEKGGTPKADDIPVLPSYQIEGNFFDHNEFLGWDKDLDSVTEDITVTAIYAMKPHSGAEPTCQSGSVCDVCSMVYTATNPSNHVTETIAVPATCKDKGSITEICTHCNIEVSYMELQPLEHIFSEWIVIQKGDCNRDRIERKVCLNSSCGHTVERISRSMHTYIVVEGKPSTCILEGYSDYYYCTSCGEETDAEVLPKKGHVDNNNDGKCDYCGAGEATITCGCMCHEKGIMRVLYQIFRFFWMISGRSQVCGCGINHY